MQRLIDFLVFYRHFQQYFSYIMVTTFSGGRSRSTQREPPTMGKQLVSFITCAASRVHPFCNLQIQARTHAVLVIGLYDLLGNPTTEVIEPLEPFNILKSFIQLDANSKACWVLVNASQVVGQEKGQKDKQPSTKHTHKAKDRVTRTPLKSGRELRCPGRVDSSCSAIGTHRQLL